MRRSTSPRVIHRRRAVPLQRPSDPAAQREWDNATVRFRQHATDQQARVYLSKNSGVNPAELVAYFEGLGISLTPKNAAQILKRLEKKKK